MGCRFENPGFDNTAESSGIRDGGSAQDDSTDADSDEETSTEDSDEASDTQETTSLTSTKSSPQAFPLEPETGDKDAEVREVCKKGAELCFEMQMVEEVRVENSASVNKGVVLSASSVQTGDSPSSPAFGHRIRLDPRSSVNTPLNIAIPKKTEFGVDVWFSPDFSETDEMILLRIGDVMSIELSRNRTTRCQIFARNMDAQATKVEEVSSTYFGMLNWQVVSCSLNQKSLKLWNSDAPVVSPPQELELAQELSVRLSSGRLATENLKGTELGGFVGDLHLVRFWTKVEGYEDVLRAELKFAGLEPPN